MKKLILSKLFIFLLTTPVFAADEDTTNSTTNEQTNNEQSDSASADTNADENTAQGRVLPDTHKQQQTDIANLLKGSMTEIIELKAQEESFNLYVLAADEKEPLGNILFFADPRTHSDWPISLSPLRVGLSHYKWQTAVMTMPALQLPKIPERSTTAEINNTQDGTTETESAQPENPDSSEPPNNTDNTGENESTASADSDSAAGKESEEMLPATISNSEVIMARAQASITKLNETTDFVILIGIGQGATWATEYATTLSEPDKEKTRLILINAQQSQDSSAKDLNQMISELKIDTFDIYSPQRKNSPEINHALARKRAANQSDIENFKQIKAPKSAWRKQGNEWLYRKVLGVIKTSIAADLEAKALEEMKPKPPEKTNQKPGA